MKEIRREKIMKSLKVVAITGALVAVFALAGCQSSSTSTSKVEVSTTTESGTKTYTSSSETKNGVTTSTETTVETPADAKADSKTDSKANDAFYDLHYEVEADGSLSVTAPYSTEKWWKVVGNFDNVELNNETIEGDKVISKVIPMINEGEAQVILAHAVAGQEDPVDYGILAVDVKDGKIVSVNQEKCQFVDDLASVFKGGVTAE